MSLILPEGDFAGYIFDCDGTLVDSMPLHFRAWTASFVHHRAPFEFTEERFYSLAGVPDATIVEIMNQEFGCSLDPHEVHEYKKSFFVEHMNELESVPEVEEQLRSIHGKKPVSVASGSDLSIVEPELRHIGLWDFFEIVITPKDVERGKPAPDMFLLAASRMQVAPEECLVFEDGQSGLRAAAAAGMASVFVPRAGQREQPAL